MSHRRSHEIIQGDSAYLTRVRVLRARLVHGEAGPRGRVGGEVDGQDLAGYLVLARVERGVHRVRVDCRCGEHRRPTRWTDDLGEERHAHLLQSMNGKRKTTLSGMAANCEGDGWSELQSAREQSLDR